MLKLAIGCVQLSIINVVQNAEGIGGGWLKLYLCLLTRTDCLTVFSIIVSTKISRKGVLLFVNIISVI